MRKVLYAKGNWVWDVMNQCFMPVSALSITCYGWNHPCDSYYDCKKPFPNNHQVTLKNIKVYYLQDLEITQHTWDFTAKQRVEREWQGTGLRSAFIGLRVEPRVLWAHSWLVNIRQGRELKYREKIKKTAGQLRNQPRSLKQRSLREERRPVYLPSHVAGCGFIGVVFEVEAFLKWMPGNQNLSLSLALQKEKPNKPHYN